MKKLLFISLCLFGGIGFANAQLKVDSDGRVYMQHLVEDSDADVFIGESQNMGSSYNDKKALYVHKYLQQSGGSYGIYSEAVKSGNTGDAVGVLGIGRGVGNNSNYRNYGVIGTVEINARGAGIVGITEGCAPPIDYVNGSYAGFFYGDVYLDGYTTAAYGIYNLSDMRLKTNDVLLSEIEKEGGNVLDNLKTLDVIEYELKLPGHEKRKTEIEERRHYGVSAQELQKLYPNLVREGQDGYLTVNYTEMVPLLLRSIQELKQELDEVKGADYTAQKARLNNTCYDNEQANDIEAAGVATGNRLYQNSPNPFTERTEIRFSLADDAKNAYIYIFDMTGKTLKQIPVDASMQSVTMNGYDLSSGIYLYSLVVNGQEIDTKRMILSN